MCGMSGSQAVREKWVALVAEQKASGVSVAKFCLERGIVASSLFAWRRKLAEPPSLARATSFVEATIEGDPLAYGPREEGRWRAGQAGGVSIELASGHRIIVERGFDQRLLLEVMSTLERIGCGS